MTTEKWFAYPRFQQLLMIANELNRAQHALEKGDPAHIMLCAEIIHFFLYPCRPLGIGFGFVEGCPGDRVADHQRDGLVKLLGHFIHQVEHFYVGSDSQLFAPPCEVVEPV